jgi:hypothetical protein
MESLLDSFGSDGVYVVGSVLGGIMILIIVAFWQGRSIQFWPPKIGVGPTRSRDHRPAGNGAQRTGEVTVLASKPAADARIFDVADAAQFYQVIARNYDQRNSANLITTHMEVITRIDQLRRVRPE